jgi:hypothetical protein
MSYPPPNPAAENQKVIQHLQKKWGNRACPMCQVAQWNVEPQPYQLMQFHAGSLVVGGPIVPVFPVTCTNCGNTLLVNAIVSGAIAAEGQESAR